MSPPTGQAVVDSPDPSSEADEAAMDRAIAIIDDMRPFLDDEATAFCRLRAVNGGNGIAVPLRDRRVKSSLVYRYRQTCGGFLTTKLLRTAIDFVEGRLLDTRKPEPSLRHCPITACLATLIRDTGGGAGSAEELLDSLRKVAKKYDLWALADALPDSPDKLGLWLTANTVALKAFGIDLTRPKRRAQKRLWDWRAIVPHDGSDTLEDYLSLIPNAAKAPQNKESVKPGDTMSPDELFAEIGDSIDVHTN
jgi:hypothetical protein